MGSLYAKDVISKAADYIGYHEGPNNDNWFADVLDDCGYFAPQTKQHVPWCAVFCDCMCLLAALPSDRDNESKKYDAQYFLYQPSYNNYSASAALFAGYFKNAGAWYDYPEKGDMIFFQDAANAIVHVGIVEDTDGSITTIEGNAGDQVQRKWYDYGNARIAGFGRPRYDGYEAPTEEQPPEDQEQEPAKAEEIIKEIEALLQTLKELL